MPDKRNALAELAERLSLNIIELLEGDGFPLRLSREAVIDFIKARRIVEELAKVMPRYLAWKAGHSFIDTEAYKAYRNCRAIADE